MIRSQVRKTGDCKYYLGSSDNIFTSVCRDNERDNESDLSVLTRLADGIGFTGTVVAIV